MEEERLGQEVESILGRVGRVLAHDGSGALRPLTASNRPN